MPFQLTVFLFAYFLLYLRTGASKKCGETVSSDAESNLQGFTFKSLISNTFWDCFQACQDEPNCLSVNYHLHSQICEFNYETRHRQPSAFVRKALSLYIGSMKESIGGCVASQALGLKDGRIKDVQLSQSSVRDDNPQFGAHRARLGLASWPPGALLSDTDMDGGWIMIDLLRPMIFTSFAMQAYGHNGGSMTMTFQISTSNNNATWSFVEEAPGVPKVFPGNRDNFGTITTTFSPPVVGRYFRIVAKSCSVYCSFRLELYGCSIGQ
ncbi:coagulation factor V [Nematostella vectensis]|uniref:coagulation factor V n=1 Tax=Nematostella vectensis TaxID=45351 RepID=UPI00207780AE|nr:coagulation factor V [Nematostella vectensis]